MMDRRSYRPEIRAIGGSNGRQFTAMPLAYEVVDDYGTIWTRGVFDASVAERMPVLLYGHNWGDVTNVLGRAVDYLDTRDGPQVTFELTDFDAHPHTRQVAAQINDGTMTDMSVGFDRRRWTGPNGVGPLAATDRELRGPTGRLPVERMLEAGWDEASFVARGAVPGAKVLSGVRTIRTRSGLQVAYADLKQIARDKAAGELTDEEADILLRMLADDADTDAAAAAVVDDGPDSDDGDAVAETAALIEDI